LLTASGLTEYVDKIEAKELRKAASMNGKLTAIQDIAAIVKFLVTDGRWSTGQTIVARRLHD
jgi:NAD(P)-dependent dehydrogenase (short-subunit alcohol dehydrogenase family)